MLTIEAAKKIISTHSKTLASIEINLYKSVGYTAAESIYSPINFPPFDQSAMDGYAFNFKDLKKSKSFEIMGEEQAGNNKLSVLSKGKCIRIFTGAKIPKGADTVVMQEKITLKKNNITINDNDILLQSNVRPKGSQTKTGDKIIDKGDIITPATAALIAGLGMEKIKVFKKPIISIINTGKELVQPGGAIKGSQIFESNSYALHAALNEMHLEVEEIVWVDDKKKELEEVIKNSLATADVLLLTGGVSVGDYDLVIPCLVQNGVKQLFHKIKQKPGKPLYFGKKGKKLIFGLPGNPASVLTCFYMYVLPSLRNILGFTNHELLQLQLPLKESYSKKAGLVHFLQARIDHTGVSLFHNQQSYKMNAFAKANAIVEVAEECTELKKDELVKVYLLSV